MTTGRWTAYEGLQQLARSGHRFSSTIWRGDTEEGETWPPLAMPPTGTGVVYTDDAMPIPDLGLRTDTMATLQVRFIELAEPGSPLYLSTALWWTAGEQRHAAWAAYRFTQQSYARLIVLAAKYDLGQKLDINDGTVTAEDLAEMDEFKPIWGETFPGNELSGDDQPNKLQREHMDYHQDAMGLLLTSPDTPEVAMLRLGVLSSVSPDEFVVLYETFKGRRPDRILI